MSLRPGLAGERSRRTLIHQAEWYRWTGGKWGTPLEKGHLYHLASCQVKNCHIQMGHLLDINHILGPEPSECPDSASHLVTCPVARVRVQRSQLRVGCGYGSLKCPIERSMTSLQTKTRGTQGLLQPGRVLTASADFFFSNSDIFLSVDSRSMDKHRG